MKKFLLPISIITSLLLVLTSCASNFSSDKLSGNNSITTEEANLLQESLSNTSEQNNEITSENHTETTASTESEKVTAEKQNEDVISPSEESTTIKQIEATPENTTVTPETTTKAPEATTVNTSDNLITKQKAKEIALSHAGVKDADIRDYEIELDKEINKITYEISFHAGNFEYEYEINAKNGNITKSEKEAEKVIKPQTSTQTTTVQNTSENLITKDKAKQIALNHAGLAQSDISRYKIETDREKNSITYEISFYAGNFEYEYEINAVNGKIRQSEKEHID